MSTQAQLSDIDAGPLQLEQSLFALIKQGLEKSAHLAVAIVAHQSQDHLKALRAGSDAESSTDEGCLIWTYTDLHNASLKLVAGFREHGIGPGAKIATFLPNGIEPILFNWSSIVGKYTFAPLDPGATNPIRSAEALTLLGTVVPEIVVVTDAKAATDLDLVIDSLVDKPKLKIVLDSTDKAPSGWTDLLAISADTVDKETESRITAEALTDDLDRVAVIMFTSGTSTGKPKGCPVTVRNRVHFSQGMDMRSGDGYCRYGYITQNFRAIATAISVIAFWKGHGLVIPGPGFSPPQVLDAIEKHKINWFAFVPFALQALIAHPRFQSTDISSVRTIGIGADMITRNLYIRASEAFPDVDIWVACAMTEGGGALMWPFENRSKVEDIPWYPGDIAPIGKVGTGARLRIADDNNKALPRNAVGEIHVSSHGYLRQYSNGVKPEDFYTEDDSSYWFKTGDTGVMNDDGWIYILGRKKDIIKRAGVPVVPGALESALDAFLKSQTSVVAVPHETLGHEPFAVVRSLNGHDKEQVKKHIVDMFGYDYALGGVATLQDLGMSDFPINQSEKIMKLELQKALAQQA